MPNKAIADLQAQWKAALSSVSAALDAAQKQSTERRRALIRQAHELAAEATLRIDAIKALQQRWQAEAQTVPLERRHENRLWDEFRKPLDEAFGRKSAEREKAQATTSAHDQAVLQAAQALEAANATGDAAQIRAAMTALETAMRQQHAAEAVPAEAAPAAETAESGTPQAPAEAAESTEAATEKPAAPRPARPLIAMRGDDRPGARRPEAASIGGRPGRPGEKGRFGDRKDGRRDGRDGRTPRPDRARLGDAAYRAQREALEHAQSALRKLATQAHGEALTQLLAA